MMDATPLTQLHSTGKSEGDFAYVVKVASQLILS